MANITFSDKQLFMHVFFFFRIFCIFFFLLRPTIPGLAPCFPWRDTKKV